LKEITNPLHDSKIADFTEFDKTFQLSQLVPRTLPIFCVISSILYLDSALKLKSGLRNPSIYESEERIVMVYRDLAQIFLFFKLLHQQ
jgi:hypothetical protein